VSQKNIIIQKAHDDIQNIYQSVIHWISEAEGEKEIIHSLFQDLSDKLIDNKEKEK
jgi:hypothetical protein